jgi:rhodanese-related sulfurtransferase
MKQRITIFIAGCALCVFSGVLFAYEGVFDLGKVPFGAALKRTIPIENRSGAALAITSVTSSCECLKILSSPSLVASGGKAQVGFSLMPGKTGDVQYEIAVYFADIRRAPFQYLVMASVGEADTGNVVKKRKQEYCISPESVRKMPKEKLTMIDIRPGEEYARLKIPGSINVPLFAVKTKNFLNNGAVILVNEGYGYAPLEEVCGNLRQAGWDAWILNGGLNGWQQKGFPVEGSASSAGALHLMPSSALLQEKEYDNWLIIDAGRTAVKDIGISTTAVARAPSPKDARGFMAVLRKERRMGRIPAVPGTGKTPP